MDSDSESEELLLDDQDGFDDFTVASAWERLISDIEAVCRKWQTAASNNYLVADSVVETGSRKLQQVRTELAHGTKSYRLELFFEVETDGGREDWQREGHHLQTWFGVEDFLVISPISMSGVVLDAPEATYLLSAVAIALSNCGSIWPAFVPVHDPTRKAYRGVQGMKGPYCRSFEADRIGSRVPVKLMHLEGLYDLFVTKLAFSLPDSSTEYDGKVGLTLRLTYRTPMPGYDFLQIEDAALPSAKPIESYDDGDVTTKQQWDDECPWANWYTVDDPVKGFELVAIWARRIIESSLNMAELENVSTFEADKWSLAPIITKGLEEASQDEEVSFASRVRALLTAFSFATEAKFIEDFATGDFTIMQKITSSTAIPPPGVLDRALKDVFQDAKFESSTGDSHHRIVNARAIKGAPTGSLFSQFCLQALWFGNCNIRAIAILWTEFVREVRWCWEELQTLPKVSPDEPPDFDTCLVHQKLQLLAACIKRKTMENKRSRSHARVDVDANILEESGMHDSEDERSFENELKHRQGVTREQDDMMLLRSHEMMHLPITQEPPIMTEDMLLEREHAMVALSDSPSGRMTRARLQTNVLSSDMAAFKAANPVAVFGDFVRWHSPRDWIEEDEFQDSSEVLSPGSESMPTEESNTWPPRGKLSDRMSHPGNMWQELWETVEPASVSLQKPLFDHTGEGEKVIHYLETLRPHQLLAQMICTAFSSVADILYKTKAGNLEALNLEIEKLYLTIISVLKPLRNIHLSDVELAENMEDWYNDISSLCQLLEQTEKHVIMAASLHQKLPNAPRLFASFFNHYTSLEKQSKHLYQATMWQMVSMLEREAVARLFPPLSLDQTWKKSLRMGNFLNGHEPSTREIVFSHYDYFSEGRTERYRMEHFKASDHVLSHRMYVLGTSNDIQVAYSVVSND